MQCQIRQTRDSIPRDVDSEDNLPELLFQNYFLSGPRQGHKLPAGKDRVIAIVLLVGSDKDKRFAC
jgi:hypothetical protein